MEYRKLAGTDLDAPRAVLGTMTFGSQVDWADAAEMVKACLEAGVNFFDTANVYNRGVSEEMLGELVKERRGEVVIATKVRNAMGDGPLDSGLSKPAIHKAIDDSLRRLQTDYVDLYYFHSPDRDTPVEESLEAMSEVVHAGKVRHAAVSNYAAWQMADMACLSERRGWPPVRISQPMYNLLARRVEEEYQEFCSVHGVSNIVYNPLAGGLLTGKHQVDRGPQSGTRFDRQANYRERYWNEQQFHAVERLRQAADDAGMSLVELAFRWLLSRPLVDCILLGASSVDQLRANLAACEGAALDQDTLDRCDEVWQLLRGAAPTYNR